MAKKVGGSKPRGVLIHRAVHPVAASVVARRKELRITRERLAELSGVSVSTVYYAETGQNVSLEKLLQILDALGLELITRVKTL